MSVPEAFDFAIEQKQKILSPTTKRGYENKIKNFLKWTEANRPDLVNITDLDKKTVTTFLNEVLSRTSARNFSLRLFLHSLILHSRWYGNEILVRCKGSLGLDWYSLKGLCIYITFYQNKKYHRLYLF